MNTKLNLAKVVYLMIVCLLLVACNHSEKIPRNPPEAIEGVLDLRGWDFEKDGSVELAGEWAFYWEELLEPSQITSRDKTLFVDVPNAWTSYDLKGDSLHPEGYATYALTLYLPESDQVYGLFNEGQGSAYVLWVNGHLFAQRGQVGTSSQMMTPDTKPRTVFLAREGEAVELVLQISNFHHRKGGFRNALLLGPGDTIHLYQLQNWFIESFAVGMLFIMGLYHLFLYFFRTKNRATLYFALLCWLSALRLGVTNQSILLFHLPSISWSQALRLEYLSFFLSPVAFALFLETLYTKDIHRWFVRTAVGCGIGFTLFMVLTDTLTLSYSSTYYQIVYILEIGYYLVFLGRILIKRRTGAFYIGFASLIVFSAIIIETLILQNVIDDIYITSLLPIGEITSFSFLAFIFVQAILLASLFSKSFKRVESLSVELEETNVDLEQSERKYRTIFEDSKDMIFIAGLDAQIIDVSPACEEVLGYTRIELLKMSLLDVIVDQTDSVRFQNAIVDHGSVKNFESELQRKDGRVISTLVSATPRLDENGEITGVQGSVRDITASKQAEAERLRALKLEQIAITDPLTRTYNRRFFDQVATKEIERARRSSSPLSVILFDIDDFKIVNDSYGHLVGDQVLINLATLCDQNVRSMDLFARFGGEEFVILIPDANSEVAAETAERLRKIVAEKPLAKVGNTDIFITISLGIASWNFKNPLDFNDLLERADQALYQAKEAGRNCVTLWEKTEEI